jgi:uncharacterized protein (TIGR02452 family)
MTILRVLPCLDSDEMGAARRSELDIRRDAARSLGLSAVEAAQKGMYLTRSGDKIAWSDAIRAACAMKSSVPPDAPLPTSERPSVTQTTVQVANETTLQAARRLTDLGVRPLALNFANGIHPGGGFLNGARAQEEVLCRSSGLFLTLVGDPMYEAHRKRLRPDSTDWAILSPDVPVFRNDDGTELPRPWLLSFITCAAPVAAALGQPESGILLRRRIHRTLDIARSYEYDALVLGAWGCGAFGNDPHRTARDFKHALTHDFAGLFSDIVFAITDWSPDRRFLGPFRDTFTEVGSSI